jgi:hypothetical protein
MRRIRRNLSRIRVFGEKSRWNQFSMEKNGWNLENNKQNNRLRESDNSKVKHQQAGNKYNDAKNLSPAHPAKSLESPAHTEIPWHAKQP